MMSTISPTFRQGQPADAPLLAELVNLAGEGMPLRLWESMRQDGETAWDVGRRRAAREEGSFSYRHATVAETGGQVAAALISYPQAPEPQPVDYATMPPAFVPLQELENLAPNTWYINILAVYPDYRRQGLGAQLMAVAESHAAKHGKPGLSVIVSDANIGAKHLYLAIGYRQTATRPQVKCDWSTDGTAWILLTKML
jgi:ribosomal protein S18 acetylase RimI-like enzyme